MGKENSIRTRTTSISRNTSGLSVNSFNLKNSLPSSTYQFGIVKGVNTETREITYNIIEDNVATNRTGVALPLYKNKIQLPGIGYIVPLLRGPDVNVGTNGGQYSKTIYYLDPIGVWQTVNENKIEKSTSLTNSEKVKVDNKNITNTNVGIPRNTPSNLGNPKNVNDNGVTGKYLITKPQNSNTFAIIIGDKPNTSYGADYMKQQASLCGGLLSKVNFIFSDPENSVGTIKTELEKKYTNALISSVTIFERAAEDIWGYSYKKDKNELGNVKSPREFFDKYKNVL